MDQSCRLRVDSGFRSLVNSDVDLPWDEARKEQSQVTATAIQCGKDDFTMSFGVVVVGLREYSQN